jgi:hypothetical protein
MANVTTCPADRDERFRAVQLLPAPATVLALAVGGAHGLGAAPLAVVAGVGAFATLASALLPVHLARAARRMPVPAEADRSREGHDRR